MSFMTPSGAPVGSPGFSTPSDFPVTSYDLDANLGALVLVTVRMIEDKVTTRIGDKAAARVTIDTLDGPNAGRHDPDVLLFPVALVRICRSALEANHGQPAVLLGRIGKGEAEVGKNPPWLLMDPSYADVEMAKAFQARQVSGPGGTMPPPGGQGWATTAPPPVGPPQPQPGPGQPQPPGPWPPNPNPQPQPQPGPWPPQPQPQPQPGYEPPPF